MEILAESRSNRNQSSTSRSNINCVRILVPPPTPEKPTRPNLHGGATFQNTTGGRVRFTTHCHTNMTAKSCMTARSCVCIRQKRTCHALQNTRHLQNTQHWTNDLTRPRPVAMSFRKANIAEGSGERRESRPYGRVRGELSGVSQQRVAIASTEPDKCYLTRNDPP